MVTIVWIVTPETLPPKVKKVFQTLSVLENCIYFENSKPFSYLGKR